MNVNTVQTGDPTREVLSGSGTGTMSKTEFLRTLVVERLNAAAQEILAAVERTVAGYEEEAAALRVEIDRQRSELEELRPEVKLETDVTPICILPQGEPSSSSSSSSSGGGGELFLKHEPNVDESMDMGLVYFTAEVEQEEAASAPPLQDEERTVHDDSTSRATQTSEQHVDLKICILEDSGIEVLPSNIFRTLPVQELRCLRDLREDDFLELLSSTFPELASGKRFDLLTTDESGKLLPLKLATLMPEEIHRSVRTSVTSALYIRLETQEDPPQTEAADPPTSLDPTQLNDGVQSNWKKHGRRRKREIPNYVEFRIQILDSQVNVLSPKVFKESQIHELQCPCGLQESQFLDLLRSTFPQLQDRKPFDLFTSSRCNLHPLSVKTLTPEEIQKSMRENCEYSILHIRLKDPIKGEDLPAPENLPFSPDRTEPDSRVQSDRKRPRRSPSSVIKNHIDLKIRILEDPRIVLLSNSVFDKYQRYQLQCPRGLQESQFLDLLRSTFPQLQDGKPFDLFTSRKRKLLPLRLNPLTPEGIKKKMGLTQNFTVYIQLKVRDGEELQMKDSPSDSIRRQRSDDFLSSSLTSSKEKVEEDDCERLELLVISKSEEEEEEEELEVKDDRTQKKSRESEETPWHCYDDIPLVCQICGVARHSLSLLTRHVWSHVGNGQHVCGACGELSESLDELRSHLQRHQRIHRCHVCRKLFVTARGLAKHLIYQHDAKPYECQFCHKQFTTKTTRNRHVATHSDGGASSAQTLRIQSF